MPLTDAHGKPITTPRPPIMDHLRAWWVLGVGVVVALVFAATDHMWRCTGTLVLTLVACAGLRAFAPMEIGGGLVVRRPWIDVASLLLLAAAVGIIGFNLDLTALG